jgi:hypothetical protein
VLEIGIKMFFRRSFLVLVAGTIAASTFALFFREQKSPSITVGDKELLPKASHAVQQTTTGDRAIASTTPPLAKSGGGDVEKSEQKLLPRIARDVNWDKYPGTLDAQIQTALSDRSGEKSADLANKLQECDVAALMVSLPSTAQTQDVQLQAMHANQIQEYQRILARCQTVVGDRKQVRLKLLDVAVEQKVVGAAAESFGLGVRKAEVLQGVVSDATGGDLKSLYMVAANTLDSIGTTAERQQAIRYAMEVASQDPVVGKRVHRYLDMAESFSVYMYGDKFNHTNISEDVRKEGLAISSRLVQKLKTPRP